MEVQRHKCASRRFRSWRPRTTPTKSAINATTLLSKPRSIGRWHGPGMIRMGLLFERRHRICSFSVGVEEPQGQRCRSQMAGRIREVKLELPLIDISMALRSFGILTAPEVSMNDASTWPVEALVAAPLQMSHCATSRWPFKHAVSIGVWPYLLAVRTSSAAPAPKSHCATLRWTFSHAQYIGV